MRRSLEGRWSFGERKWSISALLMETESEGPRREGKQGVFVGAKKLVAIHIF